MTQNYFIGDERLEVFAPTGKPMRMGQPEELNISDYKKINDFIEEKNFEDAYKYLSVVEIANTGMFALLTQWAIQFIITSKKYLDPSQRQELLNKSYEHFTEQLQTIEKTKIILMYLELLLQYLKSFILIILTVKTHMGCKKICKVQNNQ